MKMIRVSVLMSLALAVGAQAWAQSQAPAPLSDRERIKLCKQKRNVPLEAAESEPLHLEGNEGTVSRPKILLQVPPRNLAGPHGTVVVESVIDEDGCVRQIKVVKSLGRSVDTAVIKALEQWVFLPATSDGRPVRVFYTLTVSSH
jgi:TonB family protein